MLDVTYIRDALRTLDPLQLRQFKEQLPERLAGLDDADRQSAIDRLSNLPELSDVDFGTVQPVSNLTFRNPSGSSIMTTQPTEEENPFSINSMMTRAAQSPVRQFLDQTTPPEDVNAWANAGQTAVRAMGIANSPFTAGGIATYLGTMPMRDPQRASEITQQAAGNAPTTWGYDERLGYLTYKETGGQLLPDQWDMAGRPSSAVGEKQLSAEEREAARVQKVEEARTSWTPEGSIGKEYSDLPWYQQLGYEAPLTIASMLIPGAGVAKGIGGLSKGLKAVKLGTAATKVGEAAEVAAKVENFIPSKVSEQIQKLGKKALPVVEDVVPPPQQLGLRTITPELKTVQSGLPTVPVDPNDPVSVARGFFNDAARIGEAERQQTINSLQRGIRINEGYAPELEKLLSEGVPADQAAFLARKKLGGKFYKIEIKLSDLIPVEARPQIYQRVVDRYGTNSYKTVSTTKALDKAFAGEAIPYTAGKEYSALNLLRETLSDVPRVGEILRDPVAYMEKLKLAGPVQGISQVSRELFDTMPVGSVGKQLSILPPSGRQAAISALEKTGVTALDVLNLPRGFITSFDLSAAGRQGLILSLAHPAKAGKAFVKQIKALASEKNAIALEEEIKNRPYTRKYIDSDFMFFAERNAPLSGREEAIASKYLWKIPGIKSSERAYRTFLNDMRSQVVEDGAKVIDATGGGLADHKALGQYVNWATGRGSLPKFAAGSAPILNATLFSPRLILSRLELPAKLFSSSTVVRKEAWKALGTLLAFGGSAIGLAYLATGKKPELDPRSADFGKVVIGNTRLDFWGGYAQYIRMAARLASGETKSSSGNVYDISRMKVLEQFLQSKESPAAGLIQDILTGETYAGEEVSLEAESLKQQAYNRLTPLFIQDLRDAIAEEGAATGTVMGALSGLGVGVVTYTDPLQQARDAVAQQKYGMDYDSVGTKINKLAQQDIDKSSPEIQTALEKENAQYLKPTDGKVNASSLYYDQTKVIEKVYADTIEKASAEFRKTGDGTVFREKVNAAAISRRSSYLVLNSTESYQEVVTSFDTPLTPERLAQLSPEDAARIAYNQTLYADDMYDEFGNYKFDEADTRRAQFISQYGQQALDYVEEYRGVKEAILPSEYKVMKQAQTYLKPYWQIEDDVWAQYPGLKIISDQIIKLEEMDTRASLTEANKLLRANPQIVKARILIARCEEDVLP